MGQARKHKSAVIAEIRANQDPQDIVRNKNKVRMAARIIDAMRKKEMNRITLADKMKSHPSEVTRWTSGFHNFTMDTLSDLETVLGVKLLEKQELPVPKGKHAMEMVLTINVKRDDTQDISYEQAQKSVIAYIAETGGMAITKCHS
jgi:ribosome-binding protein aMBF1 (putative translation factor)